MKKELFQTAVFLLISFLSAHCSSEKVSVKMSMDGKVLFETKGADVGKLSPENGGYRFGSIYVIYDTTEAKDGTVKDISYRNGSEYITMRPAVYSSARGSINCKSAKDLNRTTGEPPFPTDIFGRVKHGTYYFEMAEPCGRLEFTVSASSKTE
ncbi:MAG TPA: hypothetical protein PL048_13170 [Leptospiraceae bacterium]|nr:hypothetical protein [Leptospiraceae bacterium]HMZ59724.1 hypothetical protein [Leptospiraceae bacterium]HNF13635.1 hypothetical protein [Leptospiraceae bacterium]HNF25375.1 hypothetical protein [Leptospiraceae bacterium]HNH08860.1 hypothetical protein [Leptospiraceae bacterium]